MSRHEHKYSKYKKCLSMMMPICVKQQLSKIWSSMNESIKQHWDWDGKKCCLYKKACISQNCRIRYLIPSCCVGELRQMQLRNILSFKKRKKGSQISLIFIKISVWSHLNFYCQLCFPTTSWFKTFCYNFSHG